jgi:phage terminase large subunit
LSILKIPTARIFEPLLSAARYKGLYGGRGSGKSHFFGELLVETCQAERGTLAVCIREAQRTLAQSSKRLIESKIARLGLGHRFKVYSDKIETPGDGIVIFRGMQDHTAESIKSLEGFKIAWIDEAQNLSARSLSLLRPTIRSEGSELWASWNYGQYCLCQQLYPGGLSAVPAAMSMGLAEFAILAQIHRVKQPCGAIRACPQAIDEHCPSGNRP